MAISKVVYDGDTLIDLTNDTVAADKMLFGTTAHGANGNAITGAVVTTDDYEDLNNLPQINSVELIGNKNASDLGFATVAMTGSYNDLINRPTPYTLPIASASTLGGIKVGDNLSIDSSGVLSAAGGSAAYGVGVILDKNNWTSSDGEYVQTVVAQGVTVSNIIVINPAAANYTEYVSNAIRAVSQANSSLTFYAKKPPVADVVVNVMFFNNSQATSLTLTLSVNDWTQSSGSFSQTVSASGVATSSLIIASATPNDIETYVQNGICALSQATGYLTFSANTLPETDISVNVVII